MKKRKGNLVKHLSDLKNTKGWTAVPNELADAKVEPKLTPEEFLVHFVIKSKPDDWCVNQIELKRTTGLGKSRFDKAISGLKAKKLLKIPPSSETGRFTYTYHIFDRPYKDTDYTDTENQYTENQYIEINDLKSRSSNQSTDIEVYTNTNNKNFHTNTKEKKGKEKSRKDSDISISSILEKLKTKGCSNSGISEVYSRINSLEKYAYLEVINMILDREDYEIALQKEFLDYINSFAEKGDIIPPIRFKKLLQNLDKITNPSDKIKSVKISTISGWKDFYQPKNNSDKKIESNRSYKKPERLTNRDIGVKADQTNIEREEENG